MKEKLKDNLTLRQRADEKVLITGIEVLVTSTSDYDLEKYIGKYGIIISWNIQVDGLHLKLKFNDDNNDTAYFMEEDVKEVELFQSKESN